MADKNAGDCFQCLDTVSCSAQGGRALACKKILLQQTSENVLKPFEGLGLTSGNYRKSCDKKRQKN